TGTVKTVNMDTGEVVSEKKNAMTMIPPAGDKCQECAVAHGPDQPHDCQSLYYQMAFHSMHRRYPTWTDALAHLSPGVRAHWRKHIAAKFREAGRDVPRELAD
ncbi:MAG: hypothetical protein KGL39_54975, partial [Patescibacteria group bacterium]|nr:hypothetical protein [Patescibacteria group bacterium]